MADKAGDKETGIANEPGSKQTEDAQTTNKENKGKAAGAGSQEKGSKKSKAAAECYCGKERNLDAVDLQCGICMKWFHAECVSCYIGKVVPFLTNYQFICKRCNPGGMETFNKKQASFSQMCLTAVANLTQQGIPEGKTKFSKDKDIIPYIEKWWECLTTMPRRIKLTWHTTIGKTLLKENENYICTEEPSGDIVVGLLSQLFSNNESIYPQTVSTPSA